MSNLRPFKRKVARSRARWQSGGRSGAGGSSDLRPLHPMTRRIKFVWPPTAGEDKAKLLTPLQKRIREEERQIGPAYIKAMRRLWPADVAEEALRRFRLSMPAARQIKRATLNYPDGQEGAR